MQKSEMHFCDIYLLLLSSFFLNSSVYEYLDSFIALCFGFCWRPKTCVETETTDWFKYNINWKRKIFAHVEFLYLAGFFFLLLFWLLKMFWGGVGGGGSKPSF